MANALVEQKNAVSNHIHSVAERFQKIVTKSQVSLNFEREAVFASQLLCKSKALLESTPASIRSAVLNVASCGLTLNPANQYATIVPRWNKQLKCNEASLMFMYRGLLKLATDGEKVIAVELDCVYSGDDFEYSRGTEQILKHVPSVFGERGDFRGVYVMAHIRDLDRPIITFMRAEDIHKARDASDSYTDNKGEIRPNSPWVMWFDEQAKKTALKRASKTWPRGNSEADHRLSEAIKIDHEVEATRIEPNPETDIPLVLLISEEQAKTIRNECRRLKLRVVVLTEAYEVPKIEELPATAYEDIIERFKGREAKLLESGSIKPENAKYIGAAGK